MGRAEGSLPTMTTHVNMGPRTHLFELTNTHTTLNFMPGMIPSIWQMLIHLFLTIIP